MKGMPTSADGSAATPASAPTSTKIWLRIGVLVGAVVIGLLLNQLLQLHLAGLQALAHADPIAARARLASEIRLGGLALFATTGALGVAVMATSRCAARELRFPPVGAWGWGATRTVVSGQPARRLAYVGMILGLLLMVCSLAGGMLSWEMGTRLLACRAGVPPVGTAMLPRNSAP
jgi:hypothetical protein